MKELLKSKLDKYDYKYTCDSEKIRVKLPHSIVVSVDFSNPEKVIIKDRLVAWNFLTGTIEMSLKKAMIFNTVGLLVAFIIFTFFDVFAELPFFISFLGFVVCMIILWAGYYLVKVESFKRIVIGWIENFTEH